MDPTVNQWFTFDLAAVLQRGANVTILNFPPSSNLPVDLVSFNTARRTIADPTDAMLVQSTLTGHREAFDVLIRRYQRQAVAVSYRLIGSSHDAIEITQNAFLKAFVNLGSLKKPEAFGGWLMRIVSNLSLNHRRARKSRTQLPLDDLLARTDRTFSDDLCAARFIDPAYQLQSAEMGRHLRNALQQLPERQRSAIILFAIEQMPQKQVARTLGCSVEAVKWHVFQGRKKLREALKDYL
ncbi:MAG TPA: sigma-70 family RNA polymerase sigma factor [Tepidisphaeraceae bacterium]|jgi:RNA polymerase sigma-70 factor (ECF subfamily)